MTKFIMQFTTLVELPRRSPRSRMRRWDVFDADESHQLGHIKWFGPWGAYCFFPTGTCFFDEGGLAELADFIGRQTREHYKK